MYVPYAESKNRREWADTDNPDNRVILSTQKGRRKVGACNEDFSKTSIGVVISVDKTPEGATCKVKTANAASLQVTAESPEKAIEAVDKLFEVYKSVKTNQKFLFNGIVPAAISV